MRKALEEYIPFEPKHEISRFKKEIKDINTRSKVHEDSAHAYNSWEGAQGTESNTNRLFFSQQ